MCSRLNTRLVKPCIRCVRRVWKTNVGSAPPSPPSYDSGFMLMPLRSTVSDADGRRSKHWTDCAPSMKTSPSLTDAVACRGQCQLGTVGDGPHLGSHKETVTHPSVATDDLMTEEKRFTTHGHSAILYERGLESQEEETSITGRRFSFKFSCRVLS